MYQVNGQDQEIRFHAVMSEDHSITTEMTSFPTQAGFNISNHTIKKNRKVSIRAIITNTLIVGQGEFHEYGQNNAKAVFTELNRLVRESVVCEVQTNLGLYTPVVFTSFKNSQKAGMMDSIDFTISGEEVQLATAVNSTTPTELIFTPLTDEERAARVEQLFQVGINVPADAEISECPVDFNESFSFSTKDDQGTVFTTTYDREQFDHVGNNYKFGVNTNNTACAEEIFGTVFSFANMLKASGVNAAVELPDVDLTSAASTVTSCLTDGLVGLALDAANDLLSTALGDLRETIYGAYYKAVGVDGNQDFGQVLLGLGIDCFVAGTVNLLDPDAISEEDFQENTLPSVDDVLDSADSIGGSVVGNTIGLAAPSTITKISPPSTLSDAFGGLF